MTAQLNRIRRSRVQIWLPPVALVAVTVALLVPALGSARAQSGPVNTKEPQISGSTAVGDTLSGTTGEWTGNPTSFKFNWRRCPPDGGQGAGNCDGIVDGPDNTYTLTSADVGFTIRLQVKAFDSSGGKMGTATSNATAVVTGAGSGPSNTDLPTITGAAQVGQTLTGSQGTWASTYLTDFAYDWLRCDAAGSNCVTFGATGNTTYVVAAADMGSTLRFRVSATDPAGTAQVSSAQTAVVPGGKPTSPPPPPPPPPPPATKTKPGCPSTRGTVQIAAVASPQRLVIDRQLTQAVLARSPGQSATVRYHVSDTCGRSVQGALVYATGVPFGQLSTPAEQATGATGYVTLTFETLADFPLGPKQRSVAIFVRARKQGENLLAGISARRLFAIPMSR
jgi:hypothetical protein